MELQVPQPDQDFEPKSPRVAIAPSDVTFHVKVDDMSGKVGADGLQAKAEDVAKMQQTQGLIMELLGPGDHFDKALAARTPDSASKVSLRHEDDVYALAFSPDGRHLVSGGDDKKLVIWDVAANAKAAEAEAPSEIRAVAFASSAQYVACSCRTAFLGLFSTADGSLVGQLPLTCRVLCIAFSPDSARLACGDMDKKVILCSVPDLAPIAELQHDADVRCLSFSPDGNVLAGGGGLDPHNDGIMLCDNQAQMEMKTVVWNTTPSEPVPTYLGQIVSNASVRAVAFSPSQVWLAVGSGAARSGEGTSIAVLAPSRGFEKVVELSCSAGVTCLSWSPDSRFLASGGEDMRVSVWNPCTRQIVFMMPKQTDWLLGLQWCPDSSSLALCLMSSAEVSVCPIEVYEKSLLSCGPSRIDILEDDDDPPPVVTAGDAPVINLPS